MSGGGLTSVDQGAALSHPRPEILALTGLRGLAALAVIVHHIGVPKKSPGVLRHLVEGGSFGVPLFFLLSGFVLAYNYPGLGPRSGRRPLARYAMARVARLAPLTLLAVGSVLALSGSHSRSWMSSVLGEQVWFIVVVGVLYAAFPVVLPVVERVAERSGTRGLLLILAVAFGAQLVLLAGRLGTGSDLVFYRNPLAWIPELVIGITLSHLVTGGLSLRPRTAHLVQLACLGYGVVVAAQGFGTPVRYGAVWAIPLALLLLTVAASPSSRTASLLAGPVMVHVGVIGLALYLTHEILLRGFGPVPKLDLWSLALICCWVGIAVLLAEGAHRYVGVPGRRWVMTIARRLDRRPTPAEPAKSATPQGGGPAAPADTLGRPDVPAEPAR